MKLSKLPVSLAIKIFNSQIVPILLYGSEVWGPYMEKTFENWDETNIERTQTKYLKQVLGCSYQTSNNLVRADTGCRPLIIQIIKRYISYIKNIKLTTCKLSYDAFMYESESSESPNFIQFLEKFNLNIDSLLIPHKNITKICHGTYDRFWTKCVSTSSKATSFNKYKSSINLDPYLVNLDPRYRIALSRFRLSNHSLWIEKGRHMKPIIDKKMRLCELCKTEIEDEIHFLLFCPLYSPKRTILEDACRKNCIRYDSLDDEQKFVFIMSNENKDILKILGKFIFESMRLRDKMIDYFFT